MNWESVEFQLVRCGGDDVWTPGRKLSPEWFQSRLIDYDFWFVHQGTGYIRSASGEVLPLRRGTCLLMRPGEWHEAWQEGDSHFGAYFVHFHLKPASAVRKRLDKHPRLYLETTYTDFFESHLSFLITLWNEFRYFGKDLQAESPAALNHLLRVIIEIFFFEMQREREDVMAGVAGLHRKIVSTALERMNAGYAHSVNMDRLASDLGYGRDHFHRIFRKVTGRTPLRVLTDIRLDRAKNFLRREPMTVGEIAHAVGYESSFHFSRLFKRHAGCSPSEYRARTTRKIARD